MGRRSTYTTKSGKFMNPTDQARKEARKRELKKNKKQRKMVRETVLKMKDPKRILDEIEKIETVELDAGVEPLPNDKALKDKKKKLRETLERLQKLFEKSDPKKAGEIQTLLNESEKRREHLQIEAYESMHAKLQAEQFANIPLPTNIPLPHSGMLMPSDIPLPGPLPGQQILPPGLIPPGPPPGEPPIPTTGPMSSAIATDKSRLLHPPGVSDADHEGLEEKDEGVDYDDDGSSTSESGLDEDEYQQEMKIGDYTKMDTQDFSSKDDKNQDQHHRNVRFADEPADPDKPVSQSDDPRSSVQRALLKIAGIADANKQKTSQTSDQRPTPPGPPPGPRGMTSVQPNSQIPPPPTHLFPPGPPPRGPPGPPPRMPGMPPGPPPGMPPGPPPGMPPGPPPGMPPNMAAQVMGRGPRPLMQQPMMPPGPPPRMPRPPGAPPGHMMPTQGSVLSAPPSVIRKPPTAHLPGDGPSGGILKKTPGAVISAKPQIRNTQAELTKLVPTSLRVKREAPRHKPKGKETLENIPSQEPRRPEQNISGRATKDDAYALFMKEMEGLL